jgi:hypothetical protein
MSTGDLKTWIPVIHAAEEIVKQSASDFERIGYASAQMVKGFSPVGKTPSNGE